VCSLWTVAFPVWGTSVLILWVLPFLLPAASRRHSRSTSALSTAETVGQSDRFGLGQAGRIPGSVNAMRVLSTSTDLEAAVADALVRVAVCAVSLTYSATVFSVLPENRLQIRVLNHPGHSVKLCKYWVN